MSFNQEGRYLLFFALKRISVAANPHAFANSQKFVFRHFDGSFCFSSQVSIISFFFNFWN